MEKPQRKKKNPHAVALGKLGGPKGGAARAANLSAEELSKIGRKGGKKGGKARALALSPARRKAIAKMGAAARIARRAAEAAETGNADGT
jgi:hypothetical protein